MMGRLSKSLDLFARAGDRGSRPNPPSSMLTGNLAVVSVARAIDERGRAVTSAALRQEEDPVAAQFRAPIDGGSLAGQTRGRPTGAGSSRGAPLVSPPAWRRARSPAAGVAAQDVTTLKFYHDKAPWQDFFVERATGRGGDRRQLGADPLLRHDLLPGGRAAGPPDRRRARLLHLVVRLPDRGSLQARASSSTSPTSGRRRSLTATCRSRWPRPSPSTASSTRSRPTSPTGSSSTTRRSSPRTD